MKFAAAYVQTLTLASIGAPQLPTPWAANSILD
jgi:hypothetical protein